jgi:hypothetical protein
MSSCCMVWLDLIGGESDFSNYMFAHKKSYCNLHKLYIIKYNMENTHIFLFYSLELWIIPA